MARLFVGNLPFAATGVEVAAAFSAFGHTADVAMQSARGRPKGWALVSVQDSKAAETAIAALHGTDFKGRRLVVRTDHGDSRGDDGITGAGALQEKASAALQDRETYYATHNATTGEQQPPPPPPPPQQQQHKGVVSRATTLAALEATARLPDAKGIVYDRGAGGHPVTADMARWLEGQEETREAFAYDQLLLAPLPPDSPYHDRDGGVPVSGPDDVRAACVRITSRLPAGVFRNALRADAEALSSLLLRLVSPDYAPWLTLQVEVVGRNACSRWHQDNYVGRAIITYVGPSTWLADDKSVQFEQFRATQGAPSDVSDPRIVPAYDSIHMPPPNALVLIKGNEWPGISSGVGVTHKAPNLRTDGRGNPVMKRFMLKVDLACSRPGC